MAHAKKVKRPAARLVISAAAAIASAIAFFATGAPGPRNEAAAQEEPGAVSSPARPSPAARSLVGRWTGYTYWSQRYDTYWDINDDGAISFGTTPAADEFRGTWRVSGSQFTATIEGSTYRGTIAGNVISGTAQRGGASGSFRITRAGVYRNISGTTWTQRERWSDGEDTTIPLTFRSDGSLMWVQAGGTHTRGSWAQSGNRITFQMNDHYSEFTGALVDANTMTGTMTNVRGLTGTWRAAIR